MYYLFLIQISKTQGYFVGSPWIWIKGSPYTSQSGTYGTIGVESSTSTPGNRCQATMEFNPLTNTLLLFGGRNSKYIYSIGYEVRVGANELFNDLWSFNISSNNWVWLSGSTLGDQTGVYGTKGVEAVGNVPGGRKHHCGAFDSSSNAFFAFGGEVFPASTDSMLHFHCIPYVQLVILIFGVIVFPRATGRG